MSASERGKSSTTPDAHESRDPEETREDIEQTREELGESAKAFVGVFVPGVVFGRLLSR